MKTSKDVHVALLRGINVGGKNTLPMKDLAAMFVGHGCKDVRTYIQSGNVVCFAHAEVAATLSAAIAGAIEQRFGFRAPVVLRSADELAAVLQNNTFLARGAAPDHCHVAFLADAPGADRAAALDAARSPPDEFALRGREIYLHLPNGVGRTKLTNAYFDSTLATVSTLRNWRTVGKLVELCGGS